MDVNSDEWRSRLNYVRRKWRVQEDVVVSGMSGRFPKSANIQEFAENLFKRIDMTSHAIDRFPAGELSHRLIITTYILNTVLMRHVVTASFSALFDHINVNGN